MSPRRNRPRGAPKRDDEPAELGSGIVVGGPAGWQARAIPANRAVKMYRCPGCNQEIRPATAHVVAWEEGRDDERRHWHTGCWTRKARSR